MRSTAQNAFVLFILLMALVRSQAAEPSKTIPVWPGGVPGGRTSSGEEHDTTKPTDNLIAGKPVIRLGNVSTPTLAVYPAPPDKNTGAAVLVCPGGGYFILAMDLEGTEVCEWLNSIGVTGVLLKYRVPKKEGQPAHTAPLQDAQRAMGLIRHNAKDWGIDPKRIGALGFSAGAHLSATLSNNYDKRNYPKVDEADNESCRPDFAFLIYPGGLVDRKDNKTLGPELTVSSNTPPTFLAMAADDPVRVENVYYYALALKEAKVPAEVHVYPKGGHGYGLRPQSNLPVTTWPQRAAEWMQVQGWLRR